MLKIAEDYAISLLYFEHAISQRNKVLDEMIFINLYTNQLQHDIRNLICTGYTILRVCNTENTDATTSGPE